MKIKSLPKRLRRRIYTKTSSAAASVISAALIAIGSDRPEERDAVVLAIGDTMMGNEDAPETLSRILDAIGALELDLKAARYRLETAKL